METRKINDFASIDWSAWKGEKATLLFLVQNGQVLLIRKKRGLGKGKINGPGGRLEPGETPAECAIREVYEELRVAPLSPISERGLLQFQFADGYALEVSVFLGHGIHGTPEETEEAIPMMTPIADIPYHAMWADDRYWLPPMLAGKRFSGRFLFDGDAMLHHVLKFYD